MHRPHALLLILSVLSAPVLAAEVPEKCRALVDTVDRCQRFDQITLSSGWSSVYEQQFDKDFDLKSLKVVSPQNIQDPEILKRVDQDGGALRFDLSNYQAGLLKIGPEVSGEFAIEMRAKTTGGRTSDMSLLTNAVGEGPGFQFGGYANTRNVLWTGLGAVPGGAAAVPGADGQGQVEGDRSILIAPQRYYRIRLEVRKDMMVGSVDGKVIAKGPPGNKHDFAKRLQPLIYVYASTVVIDDIRIETRERITAAKDVEKAWKDAFLHRSREQAMADLSSLAGLLNDPDWATREGATALLSRAGTLAIEPLKTASATGPLEGRDRAKTLLRQLGQPVAED